VSETDSGRRSLPLVAYRLDPDAPPLEPASRWRTWMNETHERWANRCLPLLIANESGWVIRNRVGFTATWDGEPSPRGVTIEFDAAEPPSPPPVVSHFGYGVVTWSVPYLFRTPPGYNLLARGPANEPKDGIGPLDGIVETDWAISTFTMNWKLTSPGKPVTFEAGEPYCMVVPQRRGVLEAFEPSMHDIGDDAELQRRLGLFFESRRQLHVKHEAARVLTGFEDLATDWEQDYFRGRTADGERAPEHQTRLQLRPFGPPSD
jgi:hypothetical protein